MPFSAEIPELLKTYARDIFQWDDPDGLKAESLSNMVYTRCLQSRIHSIRKCLNIMTNFYAFLKFNPEYEFNPDNPLILNLLVLKEAWQPVYEELVREAFRERTEMKRLVSQYISRRETEKRSLSHSQEKYLLEYIGKKDAMFAEEYLHELLVAYPTLA